jgi:hypothetical protein
MRQPGVLDLSRRSRTSRLGACFAAFEGPRAASLAQNRNYHCTLTRPNIAFQWMLLPGTKHWPALVKRYGQRRPQKGRLQMSMAVAVVPGLLVAVVPARRNQSVEQLWQVAERPPRRRAR